jgi:CubicO group peptidase (beta-lactamase class C family)
VVVKDGQVVAERYAPGFDIDTPLISYSVAKSFTNAFLAVLVRDGKLKVDQSVGAREWAQPDDPRATLSVEDLLRMRSGLNAPEDPSATSAVAQMEFLASDMAGFAANHPLKRQPRSAFEYTSANTLILDRLIGQAVGGGPAEMRSFAEREIFAPLHMSNVTMEFDGSGTVVGSTWIYAPARSFARFGELYRRDGVAPDGRRLLPSGWVAWSRRSTLGAPYGAGFWTNDGTSEFAAQRVAGGFPKDGFYASGNLGQRISCWCGSAIQRRRPSAWLTMWR